MSHHNHDIEIDIIRASITDIPAIQKMADVVFRATYARILSREQMEYMIDWMYSTESLTRQISAEGKDFYIAMDSYGTHAGYVSIEEEGFTADGAPLVHLQKIYVMPDMQRSGVGKRLFSFIISTLRERYPDGCRIELNVNRDNTAVNFYQKMGMKLNRQGDFPIGNGFFMNDYIYALDLCPKK